MDFNDAAATAGKGWSKWAAGTRAAAYDFGYDATVMPINGTPDAGGFFYRTNARGYYADTKIGTLTFNDYIQFSATMWINKTATNNGNVWFGYFNSANSMADGTGYFRNMFVWELSDNSSIATMRLRAAAGDSSATSWDLESGGTTLPQPFYGTRTT